MEYLPGISRLEEVRNLATPKDGQSSANLESTSVETKRGENMFGLPFFKSLLSVSFAIATVWFASGICTAQAEEGGFLDEEKALVAAVCADYTGCDPVILKVRGYVRNSGGTPITNAVVTGTENRRRDVNAIEFFDHCGLGLHSAVEAAAGISDTVSSNDPGFYELTFIVCAEDRGDFAADFDVCVTAPGFQGQCLVATFDNSDDRDDIDFTLLQPGKVETPGDLAAGSANLKDTPVCGDYGGCKMVLLKVEGNIRTSGGTPIVNAVVTGTENGRDNVNAIQFYNHCGNRAHYLLAEQTSTSTSGSTDQNGYYELLFSVCAEDDGGVLGNEFDADFDICVSAEGFQEQCLIATFDEDDDRETRDFNLDPVAGPTETPTVVGPTETPTPMPRPTALDPNADVNNDGVIDSKDLLKVLENWYRIVQ
jgi:hypothetical protein